MSYSSASVRSKRCSLHRFSRWKCRHAFTSTRRNSRCCRECSFLDSPIPLCCRSVRSSSICRQGSEDQHGSRRSIHIAHWSDIQMFRVPSQRVPLLIPASSSQDQVCDLLWVRDQGKVACIELHACCFHACCQKSFQVRRDRLIE